MDLLIHATLTVTGAREQLPAADARIKALLVEEIFAGEFEEHHGDDALSYDFKVRGGIPFPAFAAASMEFPELKIAAEWVNVAAGRKGRALLTNGAIAEHVEEAIAAGGAETRNRYLLAAPDATLQLAFALLRRDRGEWAGYALNHERDAVFLVTRNDDAIELRATEGAAEWAHAWRLSGIHDTPQPAALAQPVDPALYAELEQLAQDFVAEWFWLRAAPAADNAIEIDRYARYGYTVRDANVRAARLHRLRSELAATDTLEYSTLDADCAWIRDLLLKCW
ncbi:MAG: hypothetical protein K2X06_13175 [Burkholderiales bacterium]|nr:hypothetical protein [Burkholderiales bacterium]